MIRLACPLDAPSIAALSIEVWIGAYLREGINPFFAKYVLTEFTVANIAAVLADPSEHVLVSDNVNGIDGFIRLTRAAVAPVEGCSDTEITTLYVQPRHHGKGVGKALLKAGYDWCRDQGICAVWLATNAENTPAINFYLAQGFAHVGHTHFRLQEEAYLNNVYARALT